MGLKPLIDLLLIRWLKPTVKQAQCLAESCRYFRIHSGEGDQAYFSQINLAATKPKSPYFKGYFGDSEQGL